jgi:uncharacterized cupin superfamily protein
MDTRKLLLKAADIEQMEGERKVHFLNSNAVRINKSLGDAVGLNHLGVHVIYVEPGKETTEYHKHYYEEECVYVLSGQGTAIIEGDHHKIARGDFIGFPANTAAHTIVNDGSETLICLVMGQRLQHDVGDYPNKQKRIYRNSGEWNVVDLHNISNPRKSVKT